MGRFHSVERMSLQFNKICLVALAGMVILALPPVSARDGGRETRETRTEQRSGGREIRESRDAAEAVNKEISDRSGSGGDRSGSGERSDTGGDRKGSGGSNSGSGSSGSRDDNSGSDDDGDNDDGDKDDDDDGDDDDDDNSGSGSSNSGSGGGSRSGRDRVTVDRDSRSGDRLRDEVLMIGQANEVAAVRRAGHPVISERRLESMQRSMVRVRVREGESVERVMEALRTLAPGARIAPNHVFRPSAAVTAASVRTGEVIAKSNAEIIGIIDTGADQKAVELQGRIKATRGFAPGGYIGRGHGTVVAKISAQRGAQIAIADVFGVDQHNTLAASAEYIAAGVDWLRGQNIRVINISIEGPRNLVLEYVIDQAVSAGSAIIAAAGNGGPASLPSYPAAYPGVIAVTAVDQAGHIYRRAARGPHIQFAAQGVFARDDNRYTDAQYLAGTSFAAPAVAADVSWRWAHAPRATREQLLLAMRQDATDMGNPGRDPIYGWGIIHSQPPAQLSGRVTP
jgi:minor extracellular protease Epr